MAIQFYSELPIWSYDASLSAHGGDGPIDDDMYLHPVAMYKDPFRLGNNKIVLCESYALGNIPAESNKRNLCAQVMKKAEDSRPFFGLEQEYCFLSTDLHPFGWPRNGYPGPQGPYHCGVGANKVFGRDIVEAHYRACLYSGIKISGTNAETMPAQFEFQIGPSEGISAGDDLWMARYFLNRISEDFNVMVSFDPKPMEGDWSGAGLHANFSTKEMREPNGIVAIEKALEKLGRNHLDHIKQYDPTGGKDNERRLTGKNETEFMYKYSVGIGNRNVSIRIPRHCAQAGKGYLEDRRPASNVDPYVVTQLLVQTLCLD